MIVKLRIFCQTIAFTDPLKYAAMIGELKSWTTNDRHVILRYLILKVSLLASWFQRTYFYETLFNTI